MGWKTNSIQRKVFSFIVVFSLTLNISASVDKSIQKHKKHFSNIAMEIWSNAELGYQETQSSQLLADALKKEGFTIKESVAGIPTAFTAEYGTKGPVVAILGEFDALPGLAQTNSPFKEIINNETGAGHACGHHLFGAASAWAAVSVKEWLEENNIEGRVRFYGTPAEEGGSGKVYMAREGLFEDVGVVLHWHPDDVNSANPKSSNSNKSAKFTFKGISAHAAGAPELGRSALDGVEAMNMMVNMMREHIPQESRIHYVITKGGLAPNVVPDLAEVYYYVRNPQMQMVEELFERVVKTARGAAEGTETSMSYEVMHGNYSLLPNNAIQEVMFSNLKMHGGISYSQEENEYAKTIYKTFVKPSYEIGSQELIQPYQTSHSYGSTDVGDVSYIVPEITLNAATAPFKSPWHSWVVVACGGMSIGHKGMLFAAKSLGTTMVDLFENESLRKEMRAEFEKRKGNEVWKAMLPDGPPPVPKY